jgi:DNA polymerase III gamma/tau subunit
MKNILKLLEMPLGNIYFLIGAMNGDKIDRAIKNRCALYKLQPLSVPEIVKYLMYICKEENILLDTTEKKQVIISLADTCMGSLRQAISNLERVIYSDLWFVKDLNDELSIISNENLNEMINQLLQGDINLLNNKITDDILKRMKFLLNIIFKLENGLELNTWQKQQISGIKKCNINNIEYTISQLNELNKFPYLPSDVIEFQLIDIINHNKSVNTLNSLSEEKPQQVVKERQGRR